MNILGSVSVYIDPLLRSFDKSFSKELDIKFEGKCFKVVSDLNEFYKNPTPGFVFNFKSDMVFDLFEYKEHIFIQYPNPNLDLLDGPNHIEAEFEIGSTEELNEYWQLFESIVNSRIKEIENKLIQGCTNDARKFFHKERIVELEGLTNTLDPSELLYFRDMLLGSDTIHELKEIVAKYKTEDLKMFLYSASDLVEHGIHKNFIPLTYIQNQCLFFYWEGTSSKTLFYYLLLNDFVLNISNVSDLKIKMEDLKEIRQNIGIPFILLDDNSNPLFHNSLFIELDFAVKKCLEIENNQQVSIKDEIYRVIRNETSDSKIIFLFFPVNSLLVNSRTPSTEDLGIISSSIAHELNNPLAGIMAALDYLKLDIEDNDILERLEDMSSGVIRCKNLVETFLGFSRYQPIDDKENLVKFDLCKSMTQAMELMRFRLVENNFTFNLDFRNSNRFDGHLNSSIAAMTFYLIFNEIVTSFFHQNLIKDKKSKSIDLIVIEEPFRVDFSIKENYCDYSKILESKLIRHLCEVENVNLKVHDGNILRFSLN